MTMDIVCKIDALCRICIQSGCKLMKRVDSLTFCISLEANLPGEYEDVVFPPDENECYSDSPTPVPLVESGNLIPLVWIMGFILVVTFGLIIWRVIRNRRMNQSSEEEIRVRLMERIL